uniref:NADH:ubiquinone reductase (H(+)-translocating) n=1 Tax=Leipothrix sp. 1 XFX-2017 TaxID=1955440 RepID=A0A1S5XVY3_9ACAR|nr:NADH dehydrogenase subunit 5 [Leipothrix sp. 1 XFX-2017]
MFAFQKFFYYGLMLSFLSYGAVHMYPYIICLEIPYFYGLNDLMVEMSFSVIYDRSSLFYLFTVITVTCLVLCYSGSYMEWYSIKKYFFLLIMFLGSMIVMIHSQSFMLFFIGWDGLGVTSICLIMFYPNKMTSYNSFLTMIFNRLGDVFLLSSIYLFCVYDSCCFMNLPSYFCFGVLIIIMICSFTKSAQFPLSSWLPAAMSAPTPISAMVHSSTLVTAGIFLVHKFLWHLSYTSAVTILFFISVLTFFLGGIMASFESDLKKVVAFSTMSQISMMMFMVSLDLVLMALLHLLLHAFFKTFLFSAMGLSFMASFSDQAKTSSSLGIASQLIWMMILISCYSMSGLLFSSSFVTKDCTLEFLFSCQIKIGFGSLILGSLFTMWYLIKLLSSAAPMNFVSFVSCVKSFLSKFWYVFFFIVIFSSILFKNLAPLVFPIVSWLESSMFFIIFLSPFFTNIYDLKTFFFLSLSVGLMKFFTYSMFAKLGETYVKECFFSDKTFLNAEYLGKLPKTSHIDFKFSPFSGFIMMTALAAF